MIYGDRDYEPDNLLIDMLIEVIEDEIDFAVGEAIAEREPPGPDDFRWGPKWKPKAGR